MEDRRATYTSAAFFAVSLGGVLAALSWLQPLLPAGLRFADPIPPIILPLLLSETAPSFGLILLFTFPSLLFLACWWRLFRRGSFFSGWSFALLILLLVANAIWIGTGWKLGLTYQGARQLTNSVLLNAIMSVMLLWCWYPSRRKPATTSGVIALWFTFLWFFGFSFPWFGESL